MQPFVLQLLARVIGLIIGPFVWLILFRRRPNRTILLVTGIVFFAAGVLANAMPQFNGVGAIALTLQAVSDAMIMVGLISLLLFAEPWMQKGWARRAKR